MYRRKNIVIVIMCIFILVMALGYAAFSTILNINGTASSDSVWNIRFINITSGTAVGSATNVTLPSYTDKTATMDVKLKVPGDSMTYVLTLSNSGNVAAIIEKINAEVTGSEAIIYSISGIKIGQRLKPNETVDITIKVEYDTSVKDQPTNLTKTLKVSVDAVQDLGQNITVKDPVIATKLSSKILSSNIAYATNTSSPNVNSSTGINYGQPGGSTNGEGLYYANDDDGVSYFFRGNAVNNYVDIVGMELTPGWYLYHDDYGGGETVYATNIRFDSEEECYESGDYNHLQVQNNVWCEYRDTTIEYKSQWRIIRINGDGSIRLAYEGAYFDINDQTSTGMWYEGHLKPFESLIADGVFCNDTEEDDFGYVINNRLGTLSAPQLTCNSEYRINKKMWLVSADEAVMSGAVFNGSGDGSYLGEYYLLSSLYGVDKKVVSEDGWEDWCSNCFRPVINLISTVTATGSGTKTEPYVISIK